VCDERVCMGLIGLHFCTLLCLIVNAHNTEEEGWMLRKVDPNRWSSLAHKGLIICNEKALMYGACIARAKDNIEQHVCKKEFEDFYGCMTSAINKRRVR
jgi:hypothetical protein